MVDASAVARAAISIGSFLAEEGKYLYGAEDNVRDLQRDLKSMQQLLEDVDAKPHLTRQNGHLRNFTAEIQELAIRAEDVIDTYIVDVANKINKTNPFSKLACVTSNSYTVHMLIKEIEAIQQGIQKANERFQKFGVVVNTTSQQPGDIGSTSLPILDSYIHLDDQIVVGIDDDITRLVHRLTNSEDDFKVLGILGTGGGGKTTLASKLYRHHKVASLFPRRAFVSVSQEWNKTALLRGIFKQLMRDSEIPLSESELVEKLKDSLKVEQWLVVLDDIWKKEAWDDVYPILSCANKGCRVILTTRIEEVAFYADNKCIIHTPRLLDEEQKWALFSKLAMEGRVHIENNAEFDKLGKQMLGKCEGLPLAVVTLAGILRTKRELYQWEDTSKAYIECILKEKGAPNYGVVVDMLELSYLDLPSYLKPCFLYLAMFPEDHIFSAEELVKMFIAEGFIKNDMQKGKQNLEDAAMRLVDELAQRCILQVISRSVIGKIEKFRLHDLIRELCIQKAEDCRFVGPISSTPNERGPNQPRRVPTISSACSKELILVENHHLRTLVYVGERYDAKLMLKTKNLESIHEKFKLLRVLKICGVRNAALPKQIGNLTHLTYLSIINTDTHKLPKSTRNLRNLLYLEYCPHVWQRESSRVPNHLVSNMERLIGLVLPEYSLKCGSLFNSGTLGLSGPKNLQTLSSGAGAWMMKELPTLSTTVRNLQIYDIEKKEELEAIYQCPSIKEGCLCTLTCNFFSIEDDSGFDLEKLGDCKALWSLDLTGPLANNGTIQFPPNLVRLRLYGSKIDEWGDLLQVLGKLSKLKSLSLHSKAYLGKQLSCTSKAFPELQELELFNQPNLEEWRMEEGAMACLTRLKIRCNKLKIIEMPEEIWRRLEHEGGGDYYKHRNPLLRLHRNPLLRLHMDPLLRLHLLNGTY